MPRAALAVFAAAVLAACTPTGPPASGANSSAPAAVDQATHGATVGGSNDFTPGHNGYGPSSNP